MRGGQANWNQNDSAKSDYIKNRPFYSEVEELEIECAGQPLEVGQMFKAPIRVICDGVEYTFDKFEVSHQVEDEYDVYVLYVGAPYDSISSSYDFSEYLFGIEFGIINILYPMYSTINFDYQSGNPVTEFTIISDEAYFNPGVSDESLWEGFHLYLYMSQEMVHKLDSKYLPNNYLYIGDHPSYELSPQVYKDKLLTKPLTQVELNNTKFGGITYTDLYLVQNNSVDWYGNLIYVTSKSHTGYAILSSTDSFSSTKTVSWTYGIHADGPENVVVSDRF